MSVNVKQVLWNKLGGLLGVANAAPVAPTAPAAPSPQPAAASAAPSAQAGGKSPQPAAPKSDAAPSAPDYSSNPQVSRDPVDKDPHADAAEKAGMSVKEYKEHIGAAPAGGATKNANPEGHNQYSKGLHAEIHKHADDLEAAGHTTDAGNLRRAADKFGKGKTHHDVTMLERTRDAAISAKKFRGVSNARKDRCPDCGGKLDEDGDCTVCDYVENEPLGGMQPEPMSGMSAPPPRPAPVQPAAQTMAYAAGAQMQVTGQVAAPPHAITPQMSLHSCHVCDGPVTNGRCGDCYTVNANPEGHNQYTKAAGKADEASRQAESLSLAARGQAGHTQALESHLEAASAHREAARVAHGEGMKKDATVHDAKIKEHEQFASYHKSRAAQRSNRSKNSSGAAWGRKRGGKANNVANTKHNLRSGDSGQFRPVGSGNGRGPVHGAAVTGGKHPVPATDQGDDDAGAETVGRQVTRDGRTLAKVGPGPSGRKEGLAGQDDALSYDYDDGSTAALEEDDQDMRGEGGSKVKIDKGQGGKNIANANPEGHNQYSGAASKATADTVKANRSGKSGDHYIAAISHQNAADLAPSKGEKMTHEEKARRHQREASQAEIRERSKKSTRNLAANAFPPNGPPAPDQDSHMDPHEASKEAAKASLDTEHEKAFGHAKDAVMASGSDDCDAAAKSHVKAAAQHERAATQSRKAGEQDDADTHDQAAFMHRKAASMHASGMANNEQRTAVLNWCTEHGENMIRNAWTDAARAAAAASRTAAAGSKAASKGGDGIAKIALARAKSADSLANEKRGPVHDEAEHYHKAAASLHRRTAELAHPDDKAKHLQAADLHDAAAKLHGALKSPTGNASLSPATHINKRAKPTRNAFTFGGTQMNREQALARLTANCTTQDEVEALNNLGDPLLLKLALNAEPDDDDDDDDDDDEFERNDGGDQHSFDGARQPAKPAAQVGGKGTKDEYLKNGPTSNAEVQQYLRAMPPAIRQVVNQAMQQDKAERYRIVCNLVRHVGDAKERNRIGNSLMNLDRRGLNDWITVNRVSMAEPDQGEPAPLYLGSGDLRIVGNEAADTGEEGLDTPTMNQADWLEWSRDPMGTGARRSG